MMKEQKDVYKVYDKIANWFAENNRTEVIEKKHLYAMISKLEKNAEILDVGCGNGQPIFGYLQEKGFQITGVDASLEMLKNARRNFPNGNFIVADMRMLNLQHKFNAIIAWHSFFHISTAEQPAVINIFKNHLSKNGILLFTSGNVNGEVWSENGGEQLFHASLSTNEYRALLEHHHFKVLEHVTDDIDCGGATVWMAQYNPH